MERKFDRVAAISDESCQPGGAPHAQVRRGKGITVLQNWRSWDKVDEERQSLRHFSDITYSAKLILRQLLAADNNEVAGSHEFMNATPETLLPANLADTSKHLFTFERNRRKGKHVKGTLADAESPGQDVLIRWHDCRLNRCGLEKETEPLVQSFGDQRTMSEYLVLQQERDGVRPRRSRWGGSQL
jgi:hypothetical protein